MVIKIERDFGEERNIWNKTETYITGDTNRKELEVHASDLLWCLRMSYYKKVHPKRLTISEILRFFRGRITEYSLGRFVYNEDHYSQQETIVGPSGLVAHPDIVSHKDEIVMELKDTAKEFGFVDPRDQYYNSFIGYATQLLYYMFLGYKKNGKIIVNHSAYDKILKKFKNIELETEDLNPFRVWKITLEDEKDFDIIENDMNFKKGLLEQAIMERDVAYVPKLSTINITDTDKCNKCAYLEQCSEDRDYWQEGAMPEKFGPQNIAKTSVSFLYKSMVLRHIIQYGQLGSYYNLKANKKEN